ncbi:hypothetical protein [uncultured Hoeflea sp.]|uniref:hypothetical protein n=1 Tax=uncultured Hoeflea sp. TaxID=538666 RepID=UPI0030D85D0E
MTANYQSIRERTTRAVDAVMAETVKQFPLKKGKADASRQIREFQAVLRTGGTRNTSVSGGVARDWMVRIAAGKAQLHVDRVANPDVTIAVGDKIQATSRVGSPWFEVLELDDRGHARLIAELGQA